MDTSRWALGAACALLGVLAAETVAATPLEPAAHGSPADTLTRADTSVYYFSPIVVTATRTARPVFITPAPVTLIGSAEIQATHANTVSDLFRTLPGLDVTGVGVQQPRPVIRGQRGQRILLLQDAMRFNNSRRQQDFGEIPGLVDISAVERVEVVRGPASVLYGTDAIGGVVNIITRTPAVDGVHGSVGYRYGSAEDQHRGSANLFARQGNFDFLVNASLREAQAYQAPSGSFGNITLAAPTTVHGTGVQDRSAAVRAGYRFHPNHGVYVRGERYDAQEAGFGYVDPAAYDPSQPRIDITYPDQTFRKLTLGYGGSGLTLPVADRVDITGYVQDNRRDVNFVLDQKIPHVPNGGILVQQYNYSDVATLGARAEAKKLAFPNLLLTYGADFFRDRAENTDSSRVTTSGFGPTRVVMDHRPQVPNATFRSVGGFLQGELGLGRTTLILGARVQDVRAEAEPIEGFSEGVTTKANRTLVGSANALYALTGNLSLVGTVGTGFRSPNLIEWFFDGITTDGRYHQIRNPDLEPETSLNLDLGLRYRNGSVLLDGFVFRNLITDGIRTVPTGDVINNRPVYQNVNIDELVFRGVELAGEVSLPRGFRAIGSYTRMEAEDARDPEIPVGDIFSSKATAALRFQPAASRLWAEYGVRHNGEQKDTDLKDNPIGDVLPAFTVHHLRGGLTVFQRGEHTHRLGLTVGNLTNTLYAEASNVSFFRPEPGRHVVLSWEVGF